MITRAKWVAGLLVLACIAAADFAMPAGVARADNGTLKALLLAGKTNMDGQAHTQTSDFPGKDPNEERDLKKPPDYRQGEGDALSGDFE